MVEPVEGKRLTDQILFENYREVRMWTPNETLDCFEGKFKDHPDLEKRERSSLIEVDPNTFDLHLSYSEGFEQGPIIQRTGEGSPFMEDPEEPGSYTTDPDRQRVGTNYILDASQQEHSEWLFLAFAGNYVLFSKLPKRFGDETLSSKSCPQPVDFIEQQFDDFNPKLDKRDLLSALERQPVGVSTLQNDAVKMIAPWEAFLRTNEIAGVFRRTEFPFFPGHEHETAKIADRCFHIIDGLYAKEYPRPTGDDAGPQEDSTARTSFDQHSKQQAFRIKVESLVTKYLRLFLLSRSAFSHEELAEKKLRQSAKSGAETREIVFMQGCGDLTMNMWNVAFVSGDSCYHPTGWDLLRAPDEPINDRKYTCLIKWKKGTRDALAKIAQDYRVVYPYQVASLQFKAPWTGRRENPERHVFLWDGKHSAPIGHLIEFAVYGKHIYCGGGLAQRESLLTQRLRAMIPQFSDIRHIYRLPNLNPDDHFDESETQNIGIAEYQQKPRFLFNERTVDDTWLFERALIQGDRNLRVAALGQAIQFDKRELGAPEQWIEFILEKEPKDPSDRRYTKAKDTGELQEAQWRWVKEGRRDWLEIRLQLSHFPCSMIGVTAEDEEGLKTIERGRVVATTKLFFLAHGHNYNRFGCTMLEAARWFAEAEARNILIFDEGSDVFQLAMLPRDRRKDRHSVQLRTGGDLTETVPLNRQQLRCVFWATAPTV